MLLGISAEHYHRLESGEAPANDLVRRIAMVYDWNYYDVLVLLRSEQAHALHPARVGSPYPGASVQSQRLRALLHDLEGLFAGVPESQQGFVLSQLELVRETLRKLRHAS
jgi:hypothetical protein